MEAHKTAKMPRVYFSWQDMLNNYPAGQVPYTPIIPILHGLRASLDLLAAEGFDNVVKRHHRYGWLPSQLQLTQPASSSEDESWLAYMRTSAELNC